MVFIAAAVGLILLSRECVMAYNEKLSQRIGSLLQDTPGIEEMKMFGGVGFLLHGNMACGVIKDYLVVRVGPERYAEALQSPHAREFDITGKSMKGWIMVSVKGYTTEADLSAWVRQGVFFAQSLPPK